ELSVTRARLRLHEGAVGEHGHLARARAAARPGRRLGLVEVGHALDNPARAAAPLLLGRRRAAAAVLGVVAGSGREVVALRAVPAAGVHGVVAPVAVLAVWMSDAREVQELVRQRSLEVVVV